jgi:hypothetical protein
MSEKRKTRETDRQNDRERRKTSESERKKNDNR